MYNFETISFYINADKQQNTWWEGHSADTPCEIGLSKLQVT